MKLSDNAVACVLVAASAWLILADVEQLCIAATRLDLQAGPSRTVSNNVVNDIEHYSQPAFRPLKAVHTTTIKLK